VPLGAGTDGALAPKGHAESAQEVRIPRSRPAFAAVIIFAALAATNAEEAPPKCKPVERYGVKGCELSPEQTCPKGYHKQAVNPPNPKMMSPTYLMCVPDKPAPKEIPPQAPPKS